MSENADRARAAYVAACAAVDAVSAEIERLEGSSYHQNPDIEEEAWRLIERRRELRAQAAQRHRELRAARDAGTHPGPDSRDEETT